MKRILFAVLGLIAIVLGFIVITRPVERIEDEEILCI
jgi:uncharacterized membrane protein HdeD (DUF308 family)